MKVCGSGQGVPVALQPSPVSTVKDDTRSQSIAESQLDFLLWPDHRMIGRNHVKSLTSERKASESSGSPGGDLCAVAQQR